MLGTKGRLEIEIPFNAPPDRPNRYFMQGMNMMKVETVTLPVADQYQLQGEAFAERLFEVVLVVHQAHGGSIPASG